MIDGQLRLNVPEPTESTSITSFIQKLTSLKSTWFVIWLPRRNSDITSRSPFLQHSANSFRHQQNSNHFNRSFNFQTRDKNTNTKKRVGFKREDYGAERAQEFNGHKGKDHRGTFRKRRTDCQTEPNNQDGDDEEEQSHSEPESPDPYDSAYFQGIKEDGSDSDLSSQPI
ncbi:hypothetical protein K3495_g6995 [Podosphaera aphanis]|nr:hypothetical protein K3495_g6995 [Podosphaera aphanis]